jgi:Secretion system C-terminal sorting domain
MKKTPLLIAFVFIINFLHAQVPSSCTVPSLLAQKYERDVKQLATKRLLQLQSPDTALVHIPIVHTDSIFGGLAAIFNATSIPERDSVFNLYCVHNINGWPIQYAGYLVQVDTTNAWTTAWQNLTTTTGNPLMDSITSRYHLTISNFYNWGIGNYAELATDSSYNTQALIDSLLLVNGVLTAELNGIIGGAGFIEYNIQNNARYYYFYFEFADCFDGCDNYRKWKFRVNSDCSVDYLGFDNWSVWNPPLHPFPGPVNCNTFTNVPDGNLPAASCLVFPNPSNGIVQIELSGFDLTGNAVLVIHSLLGETVHTAAVTNERFAVDLSNKAKGVYFLTLDNGQQRVIKKIVLE